MTVPNINLSEVRDHQLSQYVGSTRLNRLQQGFLDLMQDRIVEPLEEFDRLAHIEDRTGFHLDWVGVRLGIVRPRIKDPNLVYFGLRGTNAEGGRPLGQAPFYTSDQSDDAFQPIGDPAYRLVIEARARKLQGDLSLKTWDDCFEILTEAGGSIHIQAIADFSITVWFHDLSLEISTVIQDEVIGPKILPLVPGVDYTWQETSSLREITFRTATNQPVSHASES